MATSIENESHIQLGLIVPNATYSFRTASDEYLSPLAAGVHFG
jgi:hypothetical protein